MPPAGMPGAVAPTVPSTATEEAKQSSSGTGQIDSSSITAAPAATGGFPGFDPSNPEMAMNMMGGGQGQGGGMPDASAMQNMM